MKKQIRLKQRLRILYKDIKTNIKYFKQIQGNRKKIRKVFLSSNNMMSLSGHALSDKEKQEWCRVFLNYNKTKPAEALIMAEHFANENVRIVKRVIDNANDINEPILICNVKNDLERIKMSLEHHRKIGIQYFAILDNHSDDGTFEWLMEQNIDLFSVEEQYTSVVRAAWIAKIAAYYGLDRWFVILDSDELLVYEGMESKPIQELISVMKESGLERGLGFMIDMYAKSSNLTIKNMSDNIFEHYNFFDTESYFKQPGNTGVDIRGGPRARFFSTEEGRARELLTKYPVIFWRQEELYRYHFMFPYLKNFESPLFLGLLHYKFLDGDLEKYRKIVQDGNYADGSALYKKYIDVIGDAETISFYNEQSEKFSSSKSLKRINIFEGITK